MSKIDWIKCSEPLEEEGYYLCMLENKSLGFKWWDKVFWEVNERTGEGKWLDKSSGEPLLYYITVTDYTIITPPEGK